MKLTQIVKRAAGHYTATTRTGTFTIQRTGRTWHLTGRRITAAYRTFRAAVAALKALRPTPLGGMPTRLTKHIARTHQAARTTTKALNYRCLSGDIAVAVEGGRLIQCSEFLRRLGIGEDLIRSLRSWFGRYAAKAWRAGTMTEPRRVWTLIDGRWTHVAVYAPSSFALPAAVASYKRMAGLALSYELVA
ncbi:hypothetical protein J7F02_34545 [Streptomyces sp. ISL-112]|uniref:hypothetical protein n=1 Tax=unclassified Streptomyces TaxID=2593676 RepID=UPI001BE9DE8B|nr:MULTISPECIES: hypothetical protein [unclassified Streptomyces]MBT2430557.1 hypothetical protein [Streptomyces sp. ISL-112]MBT2465855.1 hypothetical protein [Streptomyces sp. ISL-63]